MKVFDTIDSTNSEARRLLAQGPVEEGFIVLARHQTAGRGRYGRIWQDEPGRSLLMSVIFKPNDLQVSDLPVLNMKATLGVARALKSFDHRINPRIKWPNDIYVNGRKLCGILIENTLAGDRIQNTIVGVGINVNEHQLPEELPNGLSMQMITGEEYDIPALAGEIRNQLQGIINQSEEIWKREYDTLVFGLGEVYRFTTGQGDFPARICGITRDGLIRLENETGEINAYSTQEVQWLIGNS